MTYSAGSVEEADSVSHYCPNEQCTPAVPGGVCRLERQPAAPSIAFKGAGWTPKHYSR
jgi:hypothetical protein